MKKIRKIYPKKAEINALELKAVVIEKPVIVEWDNGFDFKAKTTAKVKSLKTDKINIKHEIARVTRETIINDFFVLFILISFNIVIFVLP